MSPGNLAGEGEAEADAGGAPGGGDFVGDKRDEELGP
jgi:hypothetical protein